MPFVFLEQVPYTNIPQEYDWRTASAEWLFFDINNQLLNMVQQPVHTTDDIKLTQSKLNQLAQRLKEEWTCLFDHLDEDMIEDAPETKAFTNYSSLWRKRIISWWYVCAVT